jgi:peptidoglycan/xylan/chitin deacetylase (PgdA/CDA1 family)
MRLAAAACAFAILVILGVFGVLLAQKAATTSGPPAVIAAATTPAVPSANPVTDVPPDRVAAAVSPSPAAAAPQPRSAAASEPPAVATGVPAAAAPPSTVREANALDRASENKLKNTALKSEAAPTPGRAAASACPNPNGLGLSRVVEIDTTGGPGFGFEHFKQHDFLRDGEVILTFDDGPWPRNTTAVLEALEAHCVKATFFPIGKHATWHPEILKRVAAQGHTIGSHTWSHKDLSKLTVDEAKEEIEKGFSAVAWAADGQAAPFFRFPALRHPPDLMSYLGDRGIGVFSTDMDSFDFKMRRPEQVVNAVISKLKRARKGMVLMHDFQNATAQGAADLLKELKAGGFKIVHMKAKVTVKTLADYDELLKKELKLPVSGRPTSSVVRTISE